MKKSLESIKTIDNIIKRNQLEYEDQYELLSIKKMIQFGEINFNDSFNKLDIALVLRNNIEELSKWLKLPRIVLQNKIEKKDFTELEIMYALDHIIKSLDLKQCD
ncbi:MAG: hypothetical protein RR929_01875 [Erysipelotrichaceae bacterium]